MQECGAWGYILNDPMYVSGRQGFNQLMYNTVADVGVGTLSGHLGRLSPSAFSSPHAGQSTLRAVEEISRWLTFFVVANATILEVNQVERIHLPHVLQTLSAWACISLFRA